MVTRLLAAVLAALALSVSLTATSAGAKTRSCKPVTVRVQGSDFTYPVKVLQGKVSCKVARTTLKHFIANSRSPHGWICFRGHSADNWAATCATTSGATKRIRAKNPIAG